MKRLAGLGVFLVVVSSILFPAQAKAPGNVSELVNLNSAVAEAKGKVAKLEESIANEASFEKAKKEKAIAQDGGVLACLAQAIAEHEGNKDKVAGAALRDAALSVVKAKNLIEAKDGIERAKAALEGKGAKEVAKDHPWNKLVNMHRMMEEINLRQSKLRRGLRRARKLQEDAGHATVITVLALAMEADTHEVKNKDDIPTWKKMSREYVNTMSKLSKAMLDKKADAAKELFAASGNSCKTCHEKFRD